MEGSQYGHLQGCHLQLDFGEWDEEGVAGLITWTLEHRL